MKSLHPGLKIAPQRLLVYSWEVVATLVPDLIGSRLASSEGVFIDSAKQLSG